jgi:hypothetical protein
VVLRAVARLFLFLFFFPVPVFLVVAPADLGELGVAINWALLSGCSPSAVGWRTQWDAMRCDGSDWARGGGGGGVVDALMRPSHGGSYEMRGILARAATHHSGQCGYLQSYLYISPDHCPSPDASLSVCFPHASPCLCSQRRPIVYPAGAAYKPPTYMCFTSPSSFPTSTRTLSLSLCIVRSQTHGPACSLLSMPTRE